MIFVTLGTQDVPFTRLVKEIDKLVSEKVIKEKVVVQAGNIKQKFNNVKLLDYVPMEEFKTYVEESSYLIVHGGVGSILDGLKNHKKVIAVPRLSKYKEQTNDHQVQIVNDFSERGFIIGCKEVSNLKAAIESLDNFKPKKYKSNNEKFVKLIEDYIDRN